MTTMCSVAYTSIAEDVKIPCCLVQFWVGEQLQMLGTSELQNSDNNIINCNILLHYFENSLFHCQLVSQKHLQTDLISFPTKKLWAVEARNSKVYANMVVNANKRNVHDLCVITCKRGSAKHCVKDDFAFIWKLLKFWVPPEPRPLDRSRRNSANWLCCSKDSQCRNW
jgi:hypothetical protein